MSKITIIGAGKTGRGFLARLLNGNDITFIDKNATLCENLNKNKSFKVDFFGNKKPSICVNFLGAYTWEEVGNIDADLILVSVGGTNLESVGSELSTRIKTGQKIIVCENASAPAKRLYNAIGIEGVTVAESTVFCTTTQGDGVDINSEWYPYLQFDAKPFGNDLPVFDGLKGIDGFGNFLNRKLYTYNSASCIIAYLGYLKGYTVYGDAGNDSEILALLDKNYAVINECLCAEYGYDKKDQEEFALLSRDKFTDKTLIDSVARNAREPQRKITRYERVVAPMLLEEKYGKDTTVLEKTLASMLLYTPEEEVEWNKMLKEYGYEKILTDLAGLDENSDIFKRVISMAKSGKVL